VERGSSGSSEMITSGCTLAWIRCPSVLRRTFPVDKAGHASLPTLGSHCRETDVGVDLSCVKKLRTYNNSVFGTAACKMVTAGGYD
jgi:hypothetical protein